MNSYWKNHFDSMSRQFDGSLFKQVGKTINGQEVSEHHVNVIFEKIAKVLRLNAKDSVVDLCCGNGLITRQLAPFVKEVVGVDFSSGLIDSAEKYNSFNNIKFNDKEVVGLYFCPITEVSKILKQKYIPIASALKYSLPYCL